MNRQKKQLVGVFFILIICIAGYFGLTKYNKAQEKKEEEQTAAETIHVVNLEKADITALSYPYDENQLSFTKDGDGNWTYDDDTSIPLDSDEIDAMLNDIVDLTAAERLENPEDLSEYGIDDSSKKITVSTEKGTTTFTLGAQNSINNQYYLQVSGDDSVYLVEKSLADSFYKSVEELTKKEEEASGSEATETSVEGETSVASDTSEAE